MGAGLWESWAGADGEVIVSYTLLTVNAGSHARETRSCDIERRCGRRLAQRPSREDQGGHAGLSGELING